MISINATLILQVIHFLILVFILNRLMLRPLSRIIAERGTHIENEKKQLGDLEIQTKEIVEKCVSIERDARRSADEESSRLKKEANESADKLFEDAREEIAGIRNETQRTIDEKLNEAQKYLKDEATGLADELMERIIGRRMAS
jgi:F-type H+-transporting ATPase subunit b